MSKLDPAPTPRLRPGAAPRGVSLQERIFRVLDERIRSGHFPAGSALPSEEALATLFSVSRVTIRAALARLAQDGRIRRIQGRGTLVMAAIPAHLPKLSLTGVLSDMDIVARTTSVRVLEFDYRPAPPEVCAILGAAPDELCQHAVRLRTAEGRAVLHLTTYIPAAIGRLWTETELANSSLQSLLIRHGIAVVAGHQIVTAMLADPRVAERLGVEMGAPLLRIQRAYQDASGQPIEYIEVLGPANSFDLRMSLRMDGDG